MNHEERQKYEVLREEKNDAEMEVGLWAVLVVGGMDDWLLRVGEVWTGERKFKQVTNIKLTLYTHIYIYMYIYIHYRRWHCSSLLAVEWQKTEDGLTVFERLLYLFNPCLRG